MGLVDAALSTYEKALKGELAAKQSTAQMKAASEIIKQSGIKDDKTPQDLVVKIRFTTPQVKEAE